MRQKTGVVCFYNLNRHRQLIVNQPVKLELKLVRFPTVATALLRSQD